MINIYFMGGSPCSGKSTTAEIISEKNVLYYFKVDDFIDKYTRMGAEKGYEICKKQISMSAEEIWMREPSLQCREEVMFYSNKELRTDAVPFVMQKLDPSCVSAFSDIEYAEISWSNNINIYVVVTLERV
ncbi:MAG: hypothetical protein K2N73_00140 [Lachnospiraceae bacterium]|nr:hypothetical protein [Lachnospiraceae bacterium]